MSQPATGTDRRTQNCEAQERSGPSDMHHHATLIATKKSEGRFHESSTARTLLASCSIVNGLLMKLTSGSSTPPCTTAFRV